MDSALLNRPWSEITASVEYTPLHPVTHRPAPSPAFLASLTRVGPLPDPSSAPPSRLSHAPRSIPERFLLKFVYDDTGYTLLLTDLVRVWRRRASASHVLSEKAEFAAQVQLTGVLDVLRSWVEPLLTGKSRNAAQRISHWTNAVRFEAPSDPPASTSTQSVSSTLSRASSTLQPPPPTASYEHTLLLTSSLHLETLPVYWSFRCEPCGSAFEQALVVRRFVIDPQADVLRRLHDDLTQSRKTAERHIKEEEEEPWRAAHAGHKATAEARRKRMRTDERSDGEWKLGSGPSQSPAGSSQDAAPVPSLDDLYEESMRAASQSQSQCEDAPSQASDEAMDDCAMPSGQSAPSSDAASAAANTAAAAEDGGVDAEGNYIESELEKRNREALLKQVEAAKAKRKRKHFV